MWFPAHHFAEPEYYPRINLLSFLAPFSNILQDSLQCHQIINYNFTSRWNNKLCLWTNLRWGIKMIAASSLMRTLQEISNIKFLGLVWLFCVPYFFVVTRMHWHFSFFPPSFIQSLIKWIKHGWQLLINLPQQSPMKPHINRQIPPWS